MVEAGWVDERVMAGVWGDVVGVAGEEDGGVHDVELPAVVLLYIEFPVRRLVLNG